MAEADDIRFRLDLAYDGTDFSGWAAQPGRRTVQGVVEEALGTILRLPDTPRLTVAGRTDAGVHATGQVAHVDLPAQAVQDPESLVPRLGGVLPPDVRVSRVARAPEGFDARFSALSRRYAYRVSDALGGVSPLRRREAVWHRRPLDVARMNAASASLIGEHDFAAYCRRREGATTIRELHLMSWERTDLVTATVEADAFCHSMVRALVGALLAVGDGRRRVEWPGQVLAAGKRDPAVHVAAAHGLSLEEVRYPEGPDLARRARKARRLRTISTR